MKPKLLIALVSVLLPAHAQTVPPPDYALNFNGSNNYVSLSLASPPANNYTISAWVYLRTGGTYDGERAAVLSSSTCGDSIELLIHSATDNPGDPQYVELGRCDFFDGFLSTVAVPLNEWTHVAATITSNNVVSYYVNGNPAGCFTDTDPTHDYTLGTAVDLGYSGNSRMFDGMLDEVQIWTNALSAPAVQRLLHAPLAGNEPGLYAYYRFNEGSGTNTANSAVAVGVSNGTFVNNPAWVASGVLLLPLPATGAAVAWGHDAEGECDVPESAQSNVVAVASGYTVSLALKQDGTVVLWGSLEQNPDDIVPPEAQSNITAIAAAGQFGATVLRADGTLVAFGGGLLPVVPPEATNVVALSMGGQYPAYTLALRSDGSVLAFSEYQYANLPPAALSNVVAVSAGWRHGLVLKTDGSVVGWGDNFDEEINIPAEAQSNVVAIAAGNDYSTALRGDGSLIVWGGLNANYLDGHVVIASNVVSIVAGSQDCAVIMKDGSVAFVGTAWQAGGTGISLEGYPYARYTTMAAGNFHFVGIALTDAPTLTAQPVISQSHMGQTSSLTGSGNGIYYGYEWQRNGVTIPGATGSTFVTGPGQGYQTGLYTLVVSNLFGNVTSTPVALNPPPAPTPGRVIAWGSNSSGQTNVPKAALSGVVAISASALNSMALTTNGSVLVWGDNTYGQANVPAAASNGVVAIAAGWANCAALTTNGSVIVWGDNSHGQNNVPAAALSGVAAISCAPEYDLIQALKIDGSVVGWGSTYPQGTPQSGIVGLALGGDNYYLNPNGAVSGIGYDGSGSMDFPAATQSNVVSIAAGSSNGLALRAEGYVVPWGDVWTNYNFPSQLNSGVTAIALGGFAHGMAIKTDGSLIPWGANTSGEGALPPGIQTRYLAIAAGDYHSLAIVDWRPSLTASATGKNLNIAWSTNFPGYTLQQSTNLTSGTGWKNSTNSVSISADSYGVTIAPGAGTHFFRLKQ